MKIHNLCPSFAVRPTIISQHLKSTKAREIRKAKAMEVEGEMQLIKGGQKMMIAVESGRGATLRCTKLRERSNEETEAVTGSGTAAEVPREAETEKKRMMNNNVFPQINYVCFLFLIIISLLS